MNKETQEIMNTNSNAELNFSNLASKRLSSYKPSQHSKNGVPDGHINALLASLNQSGHPSNAENESNNDDFQQNMSALDYKTLASSSISPNNINFMNSPFNQNTTAATFSPLNGYQQTPMQGDMSPCFYVNPFMVPAIPSNHMNQHDFGSYFMGQVSPVHHAYMQQVLIGDSSPVNCFNPNRNMQQYFPQQLQFCQNGMMQSQPMQKPDYLQMSIPISINNGSEASTSETSPMNYILYQAKGANGGAMFQQQQLQQQLDRKSTFYQADMGKARSSVIYTHNIGNIEAEGSSIKGPSATRIAPNMRFIKESKLIGRYTKEERQAKIHKYKVKQQRWREAHPVSKKFKGRSKVASTKPRLNGRFVKTTKSETS